MTVVLQFFAIIVIENMHVVERGRGAAHVWLHCFLGHSRSLQSLAKSLSGRHLFPDMRSHGLSPPGEITVDNLADDVLRLMDSKGLSSATIIGHSMGGKAAMCAVGKQPQRFHSVVILDVAPVDYTKLEGGKSVVEGVMCSQLLRASGLKIAEKTRQEVLEALSGIFRSKSMVSLLNENLGGSDGALSWQCDLQSLASGYLNLAQWGRPQHQYQGKALVVAGGLSKQVVNLPFLSPSVTAESLYAECFKEVEIRVVSGASHMLYLDKEEEVRVEIRRFLEARTQQ